MKVQKFNYIRFSIFVIVLIAIIDGIVLIVKHINYTKTYEYKFLQIGYNLDEIKVIEDKIENKNKDILLNKEYNELYVDFFREKYFIFENLEKYIEYGKDHDDEENTKIVSIINTESNLDWFENEKDTDTSKGMLMLVNRMYGLTSDYEVEDIENVPIKFAYNGMKLNKKVISHLEDLFDSAYEEGYTFVVAEGFRTYKEQEKLYNSYANNYGKSEADKYVARPGHSEYETGLSFDLVPYNKNYKDPKKSEEYEWLRDNAYKYGFIFRFEEGKEDITGFDADTWRLRYVGTEASTMIKNEGICFEEYYAYFVRGRD